MRTLTRKPLFRYSAAAIFLLLAVALFGRLFTGGGPGPLLAHARSIGDVNYWQSHWIDARTLVGYEQTSITGPCTAFRLDIDSKQRTPLPGLSRTLSTLGSSPILHWSPDGKWAVIPTPLTHWLVSVSDGAVRKKEAAGYFGHWLPDSSGWIGHSAVKGVRNFCLIRVDGRPTQTLPLPPAFTGADLGLSASGQYYVGDYNPYGRSDLKLSSFDPLTGKAGPTRKIPLPPSGLLSELSMSPDGKWLAWQTRPATTLTDHLERLMGLSSDGLPTNAVWVSRIDGTEMRCLGETEVKMGTDYDSSLSVYWLPDSRHLGLVLGRTTYTLTVDATQ